MIAHNSPEEIREYTDDLALGERYESLVAAQITALGLPCDRLKQRFLDVAYNGPVNRRRRAKGLAPKPHPRKAALLRPYQVDLRVKLSATRMVLLEVKALSGQAFQREWIHIGDCLKYDLKMLPVSAVVLINRATREAWAIAYAPDEWNRKRSIWDDSRMDYVVNRSQLTPLEAWVDHLKDSHMQQSA